MLTDSQGRRLWVVDEFGRHTPVESHKDIQSRQRGGAKPDWWVVAKDQTWTPPEPRSLLNLGATDSGSAAAGGGSGGGMKIGAGHKPQPYGWHGYYGETGSGGSTGPVYRGKVTLPKEVRRGVTPPQNEKYPPPPPAPKEPHLVYSIEGHTLRNPEGGAMTDTAYSGRGEDRNKAASQDKEDYGPIPEGNWRIEEIKDPRFFEDHSLQRPVFRLMPDEDTEKRVGKGGMQRKPYTFLLHGDNDRNDASQGCIIVDKPTRTQLKKHNGEWIRVTK